MNRRLLLSLIGLGPLALMSSKIPFNDNALVAILIKRWKKSKEYTLAVFDAMPAAKIGSADFQSISIQHTGIQVNTSKKHSIFLVRLQGFS